jgi:hypothetical protein
VPRTGELHAAAVRLVAALPDSAADLSPSQLDAMAALFDQIADRIELNALRIDAMLRRASQRGHAPGTRPVDYLTAAERAVFDADDLRALDASLAHETLNRWKDTSGWIA